MVVSGTKLGPGDALREEGEAGNLWDALIFFCTDNSTVELGIVKGNSWSEKLFELSLEVRVIEMKYRCNVLVSHVLGKRMEGQGTDGVSRGQLKEGVTAGKEMLSFIPFHFGAIQRSPAVEPWIRSWLGPSAEVLTPTGWFERGHDILGGETDPKAFGDIISSQVSSFGVHRQPPLKSRWKNYAKRVSNAKTCCMCLCALA
jgi:hypothetical protein